MSKRYWHAVRLVLAGMIVVALVLVMSALALSKLIPMNAKAMLDAGRAYLASGQIDLAIANLQGYIEARPRDPLGYTELGFALEQKCATQICPKALAAWKLAGIEPEKFSQVGDLHFESGQWNEAADWYRRADMYTSSALDSQTLQQAFTRMFASVLAREKHAQTQIDKLVSLDSGFKIPTLINHLRVAGGELRWMTPVHPPTITIGTRLNFPYDTAEGTFWWNGKASVLVYIPDEAKLGLNVQLRNSYPPPVQMAIGIDGVKQKSVELIRGDGSWQTESLTVSVESGYHTIDIWFLNNDLIDNTDRDGSVAWIDLVLVP